MLAMGRSLTTGRRRWATLALAALVALVGFGWYASDQIADGALRPREGPRSLEMTVVAAADGAVTLRAGGDSNWRRDGIWGLEWSSGARAGYAQLGAPLSIDERRREVTRPLLDGETPPPGARARLDNLAFDGTPAAVGLAFEEVRYPADGGPTPAWLVPGERETWVIFVHGRGADREEALRVLPAIAALDVPALVIAYRNDEAAPGGADGHYAYGRTEWRDLEAAVGYALTSGARDSVLYGASMGGGIVMSFLYRSALADSVRGVILDAPMLHFRRTVDFGLADAGVPTVYRWLPMWITERRFDVDWGELDYLARADELRAPVLLFHGSDDDVIPVALADELARARPDLVRYERVEGAHHVGAWNVDRARYEAAVAAFLEEIAAPRASAPQARPSTTSMCSVSSGPYSAPTASATASSAVAASARERGWSSRISGTRDSACCSSRSQPVTRKSSRQISALSSTRKTISTPGSPTPKMPNSHSSVSKR